MFGNTILILPLGLFPILLFIALILYFSIEESSQRKIGSKFRGGITEYPFAVSMCLYGTDEDKLSFTDDGKSIILKTQPSSYMNTDNTEKIKLYIKESMLPDNYRNQHWVDNYTINIASQDKKSGANRILISIPDSIVLRDEYIDHEIQNLGRVFKRNNEGNSIRWLLGTKGERKTIREDGKLVVHIDRLQRVPGFFGEKTKIMSQKQITRNIKNRLWNKVDVRCTSINETTFYGEILGV